MLAFRHGHGKLFSVILGYRAVSVRNVVYQIVYAHFAARYGNRARLQPAQFKQIVYQARKAHGLVLNITIVSKPVLVLLYQPVAQRIRQAAYGCDRRSKLMGHVGNVIPPRLFKPRRLRNVLYHYYGAFVLAVRPKGGYCEAQHGFLIALLRPAAHAVGKHLFNHGMELAIHWRILYAFAMCAAHKRYGRGVELNYLSAFVNGYNALQQPVKHAFQPVSLKRKRAYCAAERA